MNLHLVELYVCLPYVDWMVFNVLQFSVQYKAGSLTGPFVLQIQLCLVILTISLRIIKYNFLNMLGQNGRPIWNCLAKEAKWSENGQWPAVILHTVVWDSTVLSQCTLCRVWEWFCMWWCVEPCLSMGPIYSIWGPEWWRGGLGFLTTCHKVHTYCGCMHTYIHTCMHACMHASIHTYIHTYIIHT